MPRAMRWSGLASLALLVACGGGGSATGESAFGEGSGEGTFGSGAGTPPFGAGAGGGGLSGDGPRPNADPPVVVSIADVQGTVINAATGAALSGASVRYGASTLTTGADGRYEEDPAASTGARIVFEASATGYEPLFAPTEVLGSVPAVNLLRLTRSATATDITVASGGTVTENGTSAAVTLPANALVAAGGGAAPATVGIRVTAISAGTDPHLLSGDYTSSGGALLEVFGATNLAASADVGVALGQTLALRIPVSTRNASVPSTANLYYFEPSSGVWIQDGTATITGGTFNADVARFAQWMVGRPLQSPATVTGCVEDDTGAPAQNVRVEVEGISYSGTNQATTDGAGNFTLTAPAGNRVLVSGRRGSFLTNSTATDIAAGATTANIATCLTLPSSNAATMRLTWGENPRDIDSHLRTPDGAHVYYAGQGSLTQAPFASLDVDDVTGFGPEVTTIRRPKVGIYRFYLHNFSGSFAPGMTGSPVRLELNYAGRPVVFSPPSGEGTALWWHLFDLSIAPDCTMTLYRYNRWRADEPQNPNSATTQSTATECVPS